MHHLRISHIISGLDIGGAETMLHKLLTGIDRKAFECRVLSLINVGNIGDKIAATGVPVDGLHMRLAAPDPVKLVRLVRWVRAGKPHIVQTWMYNADLAGGFAARLSGGPPVIWNIRHSEFGPGERHGTSYRAAKICSRLSGVLPARIICCSERSRTVHAAMGYKANKMVVIPNGLDIAAYQPNPSARSSVRQELGIGSDALIIGLVARFHPIKGHKVFIDAAATVASRFPNVHFLLCGDGVEWKNEELAGWISATGAKERFHLLGRRNDIPRLTAALDLSALSSHSEGFPNVVIEAMSCGVPCVVTDAGDAAAIVADTGSVVPPANHEALAEGFMAMVKVGREGRKRLGDAARQRVLQNYDLPDIVKRYENLYREVAMARR